MPPVDAHTLRAGQVGFGTPFQEAIEFFRRKLNLPSERWDDIARSAHDRGFIVAGAMKADLVADLRGAVDQAMSGAGLANFRKEFKAIVARHGWTGWTGEGSAQGTAWRTAVIYRTNMASAYAAGRWRQMTDPAYLALYPFWQYLHADSVAHPRPQHQAWHGLTLRHDHPFWRTHFAPNGWGCRCRVRALAAVPPGVPTEPPAGWDALDPQTGAPVGIDKGFDYAPGANATTPLAQLIDQKLLNLDAPVGAAMWKALAPVLQKEREQAFAQWVDQVFAAGVSKNAVQVAGVMQHPEIDFLAEQGQAPLTAEIAIEDRLLVGKKALRHELAGDALTAEEWKQVPQALAGEPRVYYDKINKTLLYVYELADSRSVKLAIEVNFETARPKRSLNLARAGYKMNAQALRDKTRYVEIR